MPSTFPTSIDVFDPHPPVDGFDFVMADHIGQLQDALTAVETALGENMENVDPAAVTNAALAKSTPSDADKIGLWDSISLSFRSLSWVNLKTALASVFDWATITHAASQKATPADADELSLVDSAASNVIKKFTWANLKTALASVFDWATVTHAASTKPAPVSADEISIADSASSFAIKKISLSTLTTFLSSFFTAAGTATPIDGWVVANETWTYLNSTAFTVANDKRHIYKKGTKLYWVQSSTVKMGVVVSSSYAPSVTTVNLLPNSDFSLTNTAITNNLYSYAESPTSWTDSFNWSPVWTGLTVGNGTLVAKLSLKGEWLDGNINLVWGSTTSISGAVSFNVPVAVSGYGGQYSAVGAISLIDTGISLYMGEAVLRQSLGVIEVRVIKADGTYAVWGGISATVPFTWAVTTNPDELDINFRIHL